MAATASSLDRLQVICLVPRGQDPSWAKGQNQLYQVTMAIASRAASQTRLSEAARLSQTAVGWQHIKKNQPTGLQAIASLMGLLS